MDAANAQPHDHLPTLPLPKSRFPAAQDVAALLTALGVPARLSGFRYLTDTIVYLLCQPMEPRCLAIEIYPVIARKYSTTPFAVEHAIRAAIQRAWREENIPAYCALTGRPMRAEEARPTTCEFLANVQLYFRMHWGEEHKGAFRLPP